MSQPQQNLKILWFIPTHGDSRYLGTSRGGRQADLAYFKQIAVAADLARLRGGAHPHRSLLRGPLDGRGQPDRRDAAAQVPRGPAARADHALAVRAHHGHV